MTCSECGKELAAGSWSIICVDNMGWTHCQLHLQLLLEIPPMSRWLSPCSWRAWMSPAHSHRARVQPPLPCTDFSHIDTVKLCFTLLGNLYPSHVISAACMSLPMPSVLATATRRSVKQGLLAADRGWLFGGAKRH